MSTLYQLRNKKSVAVFYCRIKYRYHFKCVRIKSQVRQYKKVSVLEFHCYSLSRP